MSITAVPFEFEIDTTRPAPPEGVAEAMLESWGESRTFMAKQPTADVSAYQIEKANFRVEGTSYNALAGVETMLIPYDLFISGHVDDAGNFVPTAAKDAKGGPINWKVGAFFKAFGRSVKGNRLEELIGGRVNVTIKPETGADGATTGFAKITAVKKI